MKKDNLIPLTFIPLRVGDVRKQNERFVLGMFYEKRFLSQAEVVSNTGLQSSTILNIFNHLQETGEIIECGDVPINSNSIKKGRKPLYFQVNPAAHYAVGISASKRGIISCSAKGWLSRALSGHISRSAPIWAKGFQWT